LLDTITHIVDDGVISQKPLIREFSQAEAGCDLL